MNEAYFEENLPNFQAEMRSKSFFSSSKQVSQAKIRLMISKMRSKISYQAGMRRKVMRKTRQKWRKNESLCS
jgi:hypothetical protein